MEAYAGQQQTEQVFRGLKQGGDGLTGAVSGGDEEAVGWIQQIELLYKQQGEEGQGRTLTIASQQKLVHQGLSKVLGLEEPVSDELG